MTKPLFAALAALALLAGGVFYALGRKTEQVDHRAELAAQAAADEKAAAEARAAKAQAEKAAAEEAAAIAADREELRKAAPSLRGKPGLDPKLLESLQKR